MTICEKLKEGLQNAQSNYKEIKSEIKEIESQYNVNASYFKECWFSVWKKHTSLLKEKSYWRKEIARIDDMLHRENRGKKALNEYDYLRINAMIDIYKLDRKCSVSIDMDKEEDRYRDKGYILEGGKVKIIYCECLGCEDGYFQDVYDIGINNNEYAICYLESEELN